MSRTEQIFDRFGDRQGWSESTMLELAMRYIDQQQSHDALEDFLLNVVATESAASCVVCIVGNGDVEHNHADHQIVDYHKADGTPTSEPCPGPPACADCNDILNQKG